MVVRLEHLGAPPAHVVDQRLQGPLSLGWAGEQFPHFLQAEGGVQMADRVWRDRRQQNPDRLWMLGGRPEVALRVGEQAFEDAAEAGILELLFAVREEDRFVIAELLQPSP